MKLRNINNLTILNSTLLKSRIAIDGNDNNIKLNNCSISNSTISISGENNTIEIEKGANLRNLNIIIRGNGCEIKIDENTSFGGARLINVGKNNSIIIGKNCLFSDKIEIWASDTHAIYDSEGNWINPEKPIHIGNQVWVGSNVTILKGVKIEDGAIIGMDTLLTKDVYAKTIVAGRPQKEIKQNITWTLNYPHNL